MRRVAYLILTLLLSGIAQPSYAAGGISGKVTADSGMGLAGVTVTATQNGRAIASVVTGSTGAYTLGVAPGSYSLSYIPKTGANSSLYALDIEISGYDLSATRDIAELWLALQARSLINLAETTPHPRPDN